MRLLHLILISGILSTTLAAQPTVDWSFVFEHVSFPSCHASTLAMTDQGIVVAWFGGTHEKHEDVGIWVSRQSDGGWTDPVEVANGVQHEDKRYPCWNPVLFDHPQLGLLLFFKVGPSPSEWWGELMVSHNNGVSWSRPVRLPEGIDGPVKNKPILGADGTLICPSSTEYDGWRAHMELTTDLVHWKRVGPLPGEDSLQVIQPSILLHPNKKMQILCRTKNNYIAEAWSEDGGITWSNLRLTNLPNPNAGTDAVTLRNGTHYLVYNPTQKNPGKWGGPRTPLVLANSPDGIQWSDMLILDDEEGEFSYPSIIAEGDHTLHISYTWKRERIKYVKVKL